MATANQPCDLQDLYARFTIDAASEFLFGKNLDTLSGQLPTPGSASRGERGSSTDDAWGTFAKAFEAVQQIITTRAQTGLIWPVFELLDDKTSPHVDVIRQWIDPLVHQTVEHKAASKQAIINQNLEEKTFLQHLADSTDGSSWACRYSRYFAKPPFRCRHHSRPTPQHPACRKGHGKYIFMVMLCSGELNFHVCHTQTACLLTYVTYFLALHPHVAQKLREEVLAVCGYGTPTYESIKKLKYSKAFVTVEDAVTQSLLLVVKAVIDETLRLFPPVPLNQRQSRPISCTLPPPDKTFSTSSDKPLYMPKTTTFFYMTLLMQRNKALWGSDADEFDPERWIDPKRLSRFTSNPMMFTPFSAGPRIVSTPYSMLRTPLIACFSVSGRIMPTMKPRFSS